MTINERLQMVIKMNRMTNASFADKIGVQRSSVSHVLSGRNKPSVDFVQKILDAFPRIDANWLISGRRVGKREGEFQVSQENPILIPDTLSAIEENTDTSVKEKTITSKSSKKIHKIVVFYEDNTFEEYLSSNQ